MIGYLQSLSISINAKRPMETLKKHILTIKEDLTQKVSKAQDLENLEAVRIEYLGRQGIIAQQIMPELKKLSLEEKQIFGPIINQLKEQSQIIFESKKRDLENKALLKLLEKDCNFDVTFSKPQTQTGSLHPITLTYNKVRDIFLSMGYEIHDGREVETDWYNFGALNIPEDHPARDMWDTFWLDIPGLLLRTHTSTVQIHAMEKQELPLALVAPGRVYRHEATDATHDFMFNQVEGLVIDTNIALTHLLGTVEAFLRAFFEDESLKIRVRPSYFPFVEPGIEIDMSSNLFKNRWIEIAGAGLVHPHVLNACKIDPNKYSGFAFGFGLDRLTMLKYGIDDIRLFSSNKLEFLKQF